ncbi:unnamed protein product [Trifolium pratense]|uniref:Uncharacterized protein n=1 Tax=Trifolium pratense TaxID=57577 RepID=A0ACB0KPB5_TRIPR|nr:unnamed protein product [Trifolium pratense]
MEILHKICAWTKCVMNSAARTTSTASKGRPNASFACSYKVHADPCVLSITAATFLTHNEGCTSCSGCTEQPEQPVQLQQAEAITQQTNYSGRTGRATLPLDTLTFSAWTTIYSNFEYLYRLYISASNEQPLPIQAVRSNIDIRLNAGKFMFQLAADRVQHEGLVTEHRGPDVNHFWLHSRLFWLHSRMFWLGLHWLFWPGLHSRLFWLGLHWRCWLHSKLWVSQKNFSITKSSSLRFLWFEQKNKK